jgi:hypothetical protein
METKKNQMWGTIMEKQNTNNLQGTSSTKISVMARCIGSGWSRVQQWHSKIYCLRACCVCEWKKWKKGSPNSQNPHIYLHVLEMTHGAHEVHSSPFGSHSPSPKELMINSYPPHIIKRIIYIII